MLHSELDSHSVLGTLLNSEWGLLELRYGIGGVEVEDDVGSSCYNQSKLKNNNLGGT